jgi:hypothetical protein
VDTSPCLSLEEQAGNSGDLAATASQSFAELDNLLIVKGVRPGMRRGQTSDWSVSTGR